MGYSYQDLQTRIAVLEDKLDFVMKTFTVIREKRSIIDPNYVTRESSSLLDLYRQTQAAGLQVLSREEALANGIDPDSAQTDAQTEVDNGNS